MPRSRPQQDSVQIHEDEPDDFGRPPSLAEVAEMAGWWPGMGAVLLPKDANASPREMTMRVRTAKSIERELIDNYMEEDGRESGGLSMITGYQTRFLEDLADIENKKCKEKKRKGTKHQIKPYLEEQFPLPNSGRPFERKDAGKPHLREEVLGHDKETGAPDVEVSCSWSPTQIRSKTQQLLQSPGSKLSIDALCDQMEVTREEYSKFMNAKNLERGHISRFYIQAAYYFAKKDEGLVPVDQKASKKRKDSSTDGPEEDGDTGAVGDSGRKRPRMSSSKTNTKTSPKTNTKSSSKSSTKPGTKGDDKPKTKKQLKEEENAEHDVSGVALDKFADREDAGEVPVYETCDSIRRMIRTHLSKCHYRTKADLIRSMSDQLPPSGPQQIQGAQLTRFERQKGSRGGITGTCFYTAYIYFEKLRIEQGKARSKFRQEMEDIWRSSGIERVDDTHRPFILMKGQRLGRLYNKHGQFTPNIYYSIVDAVSAQSAQRR